MNADLERFFGSMDRLFARTGDSDAVSRDAEAGAGLRLYGDFVESHVQTTLQKIYPATQAALGEAFVPLAREYYRQRPARHFELNRAAEGFVAFLSDRAESQRLPSFVPSLARFEWTDFAIYASEQDLPATVDVATVNPTLTVLEHPFRLTRFLAIPSHERSMAPEAEAEVALLWRHPRTELTTFVAADPVRLLALKLVLEQIPLDRAAEETGASLETLNAALEQGAEEGFLLLPAHRQR